MLEIELLMKSARSNRGLTLSSISVKNLLELIFDIDALLGAYVNEYGDTLGKELTGLGAAVYAEVITETEEE